MILPILPGFTAAALPEAEATIQDGVASAFRRKEA